MWIDPNDPDHIIVGNDGGVSVSYDGGGNYDFGAILPISQFYNVSFDFAQPYNICGGAQDNGSWCGPSRLKSGGITNANWFMFLFGDGFVTQQDPTDSNIIYGESQGGNIARFDRRTSESTRLVKPSWRPRYQQYEDSVVVARGDTVRPATQDAERRIATIRTRQLADSAELGLRWNWNTPFVLSPHNPQVLYAGSNRVLKSTQRGDNLYPISPDLSRKQTAKIDTSMRKTGGITLDATGAETYGTIVSLAESPVRPGYLYAGTDDGNVWLTRNDGGSWEQVPAARFPRLPAAGAYVSEIEPSYADSLTFYITFDNHRVGDFAPYVYATSDGGRSFRSIAANLPTGGPDFVHVIKEDPHNRDLLFVGTSVGVYASLDRGASWRKFMTGMPTLPVYDLKIHPRDRELVAATHGRGFYVVDVTPLEQMAGERGRKVVAEAVYLFEPKRAQQFAHATTPSNSPSGPGHQWYSAPSPPYGAEIVYRIGPGGQPAAANGGAGSAESGEARPAGQGDAPPAADTSKRPRARIVITDVKGDTVQTLDGPATPGLHKVVWNYRRKRAARQLSPSQRRDSVLQAQRGTFVLDSLAKAGTFPAPVIERMRQALASGDLGSLFRGGGGGERGKWNPRPGEGKLRPPPGQSAPGTDSTEAGEEVDVSAALETFPGGFRDLQQLLRPPGSRTEPEFGGGLGGGNRAPSAGTGDYLVTLSVGGKDLKQVLHVEQVEGGGASDSRFVEEDDQ
jgi:hypothetical protein